LGPAWFLSGSVGHRWSDCVFALLLLFFLLNLFAPILARESAAAAAFCLSFLDLLDRPHYYAHLASSLGMREMMGPLPFFLFPFFLSYPPPAPPPDASPISHLGVRRRGSSFSACILRSGAGSERMHRQTYLPTAEWNVTGSTKCNGTNGRWRRRRLKCASSTWPPLVR
jgi:hypothetical protein